MPDTVFTEIDGALGYMSPRQKRSSGRGRDQSSGNATLTGIECKEEFNRIAAVLDVNAWMQRVIEKSSSSSWLLEHDYAEPMMKFGRPRSSNILQEAVAAFNKYVNFIRLSERREPFLFGLWWEKEDAHADYWLLPKPREEDEEFDRRHATMVIPIANEWTEEVVVSSEETVDYRYVQACSSRSGWYALLAGRGTMRLDMSVWRQMMILTGFRYLVTISYKLRLSDVAVL